MAVELRPVVAVDGAREVIRLLRDHLPPDTKWSLEVRDGYELMYHLTVYVALENSWALRELVREYMADLMQRGVTMVLLFGSPDVLAMHPDAEVFGLND